MMSSRRQQGAVNVVFLVITIIIALAGWGLWYSAHKEAEDAKKAADERAKTLEVAEARFNRARTAYDALAEDVGNIAPLPSDPSGMSLEAWQTALSEGRAALAKARANAKERFEATGTEGLKVLDLFLPAEQRINALQNQINQLQRERDAAVTEKTAADRSNVDIATKQNEELAAKNAELAQIRDRGDTLLRASEEKNEATSKQLREMTERYEKAIGDHRAEVQKVTDQMLALDREVALFRAPDRIKRMAELPDGKVIEVDYRTGMCWIDIGSRHFVRRGTRFKTYDVLKGGVREDHGYIVVHDILPEKSMCSIEGQAPVRMGDLITNPHFDREGSKRFFFLGTLPGRFDNQTAANILRSYGAQVDEKLSVHVDFVVIGDDPNPEAVGENANPEWFKDRPEYTDAQRWGIEMIRARDLETYLQY
jgi:hypothetical protein